MQISQMYERLLSQERYSREYNLRFYNIPETVGEDCIDKLLDIFQSDMGYRPELENAHRVGGHREDGKSRPIIVKFLYRPERHRILLKRGNLKNGVWLSEDLIWEDRQKKKQYKDAMKEAYERGQKPRFYRATVKCSSSSVPDSEQLHSHCTGDGKCSLKSEAHQHPVDKDNIEHNKAKYYTSPIDDTPLIPKGTKPILLWWTEHIFPHDKSQTRYEIYCKKGGCITTIDKKLKNNIATRGIIFYGTDFRADELPLPRLPWHEWALFHEESPKNNWMLTHADALSMFNHTATFRRESDYPISSQYIRDIRDLTDTKPIPVSEKNRLQKEKGLAAVVYLQRDCHTPSDREGYMVELMKHIKIDSYGPCQNNKKMPPEIDGFHKLHSLAYYEFLAQYKFHIAFENAICNDYMTEKLFRPIEVGALPIYMGSPLAKDWLPNDKSAIFVNDFDSPEDLAKYIKYLDSNDQEYEKYLEYKKTGKITNQFLLDSLRTRPWKILGDWDKVNFGHRMFAGFECHLCDCIHERQEQLRRHQLNHDKVPPPHPRIAKPDHLACPKPKRSNKETGKGWTGYSEGRREAKAFKQMLEANETDTTLYVSKYLKEFTDKYPR